MAGFSCSVHSRQVAGCKGCQRVGNAYDRRRRRMIAAGTWLRPVPAETVRDHVAHLRAAGMSLMSIARAGKVAPKTLYSVTHDSRKTVQGATAAAILAVQPQKVMRVDLVPAVGVGRRVRALVAIGWSMTELGRQLDKPVQPVWEMAWDKSPTVTKSTFVTVAALYERLSGRPGGSVRARNDGRRRGWPPPLAWEDIDDPDEVPNLGESSAAGAELIDPVRLDRALSGTRVALTKAEQHHAVHRGIDQGMPLYLVAERLHMSYSSTSRCARRPLPDDFGLVA